jgi:hypothetical protein
MYRVGAASGATINLPSNARITQEATDANGGSLWRASRHASLFRTLLVIQLPGGVELGEFDLGRGGDALAHRRTLGQGGLRTLRSAVASPGWRWLRIAFPFWRHEFGLLALIIHYHSG